MPHFLADAQLFYLTDDDIADGWTQVLPTGAVQVSDAEVDAIRNPTPTLAELQAAKISAINAKAATLRSAGYAHSSTEHVALDTASLGRLAAMASTALAASAGTVSWPSEYSNGWITVENTRIALATAADGLSLATAAIAYDAAITQAGRALKDAILSAADTTALAAIDVSAGWPS